MTRAPHEVILASAGTGKTFRLARRYVRLLAAGEDHGSILATTFTRKAAREILARVLQWLARGAAGGEEFQALTRDVWGADPPPGDWSAERCQELLGEVVRGLHRFQVRTLDAWFASLAKLFGLELGLPPGWAIADDRDDARLRDAVLTRLFEEQGEAAESMLAGLQGGDFTRRVHSAQQELLGAGLELLRDSDPPAWEAVSPEDLYDDSAVEQAVEALAGAPLKQTKGNVNDKRWSKAREAGVIALANGDWLDFLGKGLGAKALEGDYSYYGDPFDDALSAALDRCVEIAKSRWLVTLHATNRAIRELLEAFESRYADAKRAEGGYRHDDVPRALVAAAERLDPVSVAYRSGARIRHLMLDEFQDTSVWQWRVLEPLLSRITNDERMDGDGGPPSLFCVGDVKQAIYTWRQGEPELLAGLSKEYELGEPEQLSESWRSSQAVLDLVNAVFGPLGERADAVPGMDTEAARLWAERWLPHAAARAGLGGAARARIVAKDEDGKAPVLEQCADEVQRLYRKHPEGTIGVLLRRRDRMAPLLHLLEERGIQASGEGGSELTDAQGVQAILSAFRLADAPTDTLAAYHLASGPLQDAVGLDGKLAGDRRRFADAAAEVSAKLRARLQELGVGGFVESFRAAVAAGWPGDRWEKRRYTQLVDLAHAFDAGPARRPADFVAHVEGTPLENPAPSRVRLMTIHGSKGLEFDSVVFPLWHRDGGRNGIFLSRREIPQGAYRAVSKRPSQELASLSTELETLFDATATRDQTEALCVLYVALTRAKRRLEVLVEEGPERTSSFSLARLVEAMLELDLDKGWEKKVPDTEGSGTDPAGADAAGEMPGVPGDAGDAADDGALLLQPAAGTRGRPRWAPSGAEAEQLVEGRRLFLRGGDAARTRGTAIHRLFQEVEWLDQPAPFAAPDVELSALLVQEGVGDGSTHVDALRSFRKSLMRTEVKQLLMRAAYQEAGGQEPWVWRERRFAVRLPEPGGEEDAILHGEFDRVVVERDADGAPLRAHVVDFKTGRVRDDEELARKTEAYRPQMLAYRRAVCALTGLAPDAVRLSLLFVDAGRVAHLDQA